MIKGFAPMIREVIRTERMPPWHADPPRRIQEQSGAVHGQHEDPGPLDRSRCSTGSGSRSTRRGTEQVGLLGNPDLVLELPRTKCFQTGVVPYQDVRVKNRPGAMFGSRPSTTSPGNRSVVHHILGYSPAPGPGRWSWRRAEGTAQQPGQPSPRSLQLMKLCSTPAGAEQVRTRVSRSDAAALAGGASIGGYVPGAAPAKFPGGNRVAQEGFRLPFPDPLHPDRQGGDRRDFASVCTSRAAKIFVAQYGADGSPPDDSGEHAKAYSGVDVARSIATCTSTA